MTAMPSLVTIDLETTGLDSQKDAIIEIGAVRFNGSRVESEWTTLINPGRPIPALVTQLTGITNDMVRNAPPIRAVLQELADYVGDSPVVGHNVRFDLGFLQKQGILLDSEAIDTYDLAAVLMPTASRYNLGSLGQILGILIPNSHRALDDARLTHAVFYNLYEKALTLPIDILPNWSATVKLFPGTAPGCSTRFYARGRASRSPHTKPANRPLRVYSPAGAFMLRRLTRRKQSPR